MKFKNKIDVAYYSEWDEIKPWKNKLRANNISLLQWPDEIINPNTIKIALVWDAPLEFWNSFPNLRLVHSLGAGVDHIDTSNIDSKIKITRLVDPDLSSQMAEYIIMSVLICQRNFFCYLQQNKISMWKQLQSISKDEFIISLLGYGKIGRYVNKRLNLLGFETKIWTRTKKSTNSKNYFFGVKQLSKCIEGSNCLISLLPLTKDTKNIVSLNEFKVLGSNSYFINVGRGQTVNEKDLIYALNNNIIKGAILDVFEKEPLKRNHPFWKMDNVITTPHIAAVTRVTDYAVASFVNNIKALYKNKPLKNLISKNKGY